MPRVFLCLLSLDSAFVGGERISLDEKRLVLLKPVVLLSFTLSVLRDLVYNYEQCFYCFSKACLVDINFMRSLFVDGVKIANTRDTTLIFYDL